MLIIRWARTERQFVQFALDALQSAGVVASAAVLNDVDLRAQQRRGYRDRSVVYTDECLYRVAPGERRDIAAPAALSAAAPDSDANLAPDAQEQGADGMRSQPELAGNAAKTETSANSDIQRLYDRYYG